MFLWSTLKKTTGTNYHNLDGKSVRHDAPTFYATEIAALRKELRIGVQGGGESKHSEGAVKALREAFAAEEKEKL